MLCKVHLCKDLANPLLQLRRARVGRQAQLSREMQGAPNRELTVKDVLLRHQSHEKTHLCVPPIEISTVPCHVSARFLLESCHLAVQQTGFSGQGPITLRVCPRPH